MSLPKHNPVLRGLYILLVLLMFAFMIMVIRAYWPDDARMANWNNGDYQQEETASSAATPEPQPDPDLRPEPARQNLPVEQSVPSIAKAEPNTGLISMPGKSVVGIPFKLDLKKPIEAQMEAFWQTFADNQLLHQLPNITSSNKVYSVFLAYNNNNTVNLVIGYQTNSTNSPSGFQAVQIPSGSYLLKKSVLDTWDTANQLEVQLDFKFDYEIYTLDNYYKVISQVAYLRVKS